jgi:putative intracellular protease/amidase
MRPILNALSPFPLVVVLALGASAARSESAVDGRRTVAIVVFEGVELLDFAGPGEVFAAADRGDAFRVYTVASTHAPLVSQGFVKIIPDHSIDDAPTPDIVVVPGGNVGSLIDDSKAMQWLKKVSGTDTLTMSVCNGAIVLATNGLLDGMKATTHWSAVPRLRQFSKTTVVPDARFTDNGRVVTTAGVSAGIDGAMHVVQRLLGEDIAWSTARYMMYSWEPELSPRFSAQDREALRALVFQDFATAERKLRPLVSARPKDAVLTARLGGALAGSGKSEAAAEAFERAIALGDDRPATLFHLAEVQLAAKRAKDAVKTLGRQAARRPSPSAFYNLATVQAVTGDSESALDSLERAVSLGFRDRRSAEQDPDLASLRQDARFNKLLARLN